MLWKRLQQFIERRAERAQLTVHSPRVTPDPDTAARLAKKTTDYVPTNGFHSNIKQERKRR